MEKNLSVLAIGNSFSEDAMRYLHQISKADGVNLTAVNLMIGGCPLSRHYKNMIADKRDYGLEYNGEWTGFYVTLEEAVLSRDWDFITLQQVSHQSPYYDTYQPYLNELAAYIRRLAPKAKLLIHQTWAYEQGSERLCVELGYKDQSDMYNDIKASYEKASKEINADDMILSGELLQLLIKRGIKVHRDTFHASFGLGRYAIGLLWYSTLTGNSVEDNSFCDFDEEISQELIGAVKECVMELKK